MKAFVKTGGGLSLWVLGLTLWTACPGEPVTPPEPMPAPAASGLPAELRPPSASGGAGPALERTPTGPGLPDSLKPPR